MGTSDGHVVGTTQIVNHGSPAVRWNVVILSEGYTDAQLGQFHSDVDSFLATLSTTPPFDGLWCGINVYRVDVASTDSGADDPATCGGPGTTAATYFDATFCGDGVIRRLLVVDDATVHQVVNAQAPQAHVILVMVNTTEYGGSGGGVATFSLAPGAADIGIHETGHTAFGLADEYAYYADCSEPGHDHHPAGEPAQPNVTLDDNRATIKWRDLILASTPMPTMANPDCAHCDTRPSPVPAGTVGAFEGAHYYRCGAYRGEYNCKMRELGQPFCAVCRKAIRQTLARFTTCCSSWTFGDNTIDAGASQRWWLWWPAYPGFEVIGVEPGTPDMELRYDTPGMQLNPDGSATYFITVTNNSSAPAQYAFRGAAV
jgi:hypothetical protein